MYSCVAVAAQQEHRDTHGQHQRARAATRATVIAPLPRASECTSADLLQADGGHARGYVGARD